MKKILLLLSCAFALVSNSYAQEASASVSCNNLDLRKGGKAKSLTIKLESPADVAMVGLDVELPEGVEYAGSFTKGAILGDGFDPTVTKGDDGCNVLIMEMSENVFPQKSGVLITLNIKTTDAVEGGDFKGAIKNIQVSDLAGEPVAEFEDVEFDIFVLDKPYAYDEPEGLHKLENGLGLLTPGVYENIGMYSGTWSGNSLKNERDWSKFEYLWIKYKDFSGAINFGIMYSEWLASQSWGEQYKDKSVAIKEAEGVIGIKINSEDIYVNGNAKENGEYVGDIYSKHIREIFIQATSGGSNITIEEMWLGSEEDYLAAYKAAGGFVPERPAVGGSMTMWEGSHVYDGWGVSDVIDPLYFSVAEVGDIIYCTVQDVAEGDGFNPLFKHLDYSDFTDLQTNEFDKGETYFKATINEEALAYLQENGLRFQGLGFTLTKVELQVPDPTGIKSLNKIEKNGAIYNLAGQKVDKNYKGIVIVNGKKVMNK